MQCDDDRDSVDDELLERGAAALRSVPRDVLNLVLRKFSCMSDTLTEIEDWFNTRDAAWAAATASPSSGRAPPLTFATLDEAIGREEPSLPA